MDLSIRNDLCGLKGMSLTRVSRRGGGNLNGPIHHIDLIGGRSVVSRTAEAAAQHFIVLGELMDG
jgi:hypothetical protein